MKPQNFAKFCAFCGIAWLMPACEDRQYVSPDTVSLSITNDDTGVERVNRCNFIPVLLGSEVKARYQVEGDLKATLTITSLLLTRKPSGGFVGVSNGVARASAKPQSPKLGTAV